jgi:chromosome segregation ATPase
MRRQMFSFSPDYRTRVARVASSSGRGPQITAEEAAELERARDRMIARHKLIEGIIRNNEMQLKNESARGGTEIELECAKRDIARDGDGRAAQDEFEQVSKRLTALQDEHARLVAEREWLNAALLRFDSSPSDDEHKRSGHA